MTESREKSQNQFLPHLNCFSYVPELRFWITNWVFCKKTVEIFRRRKLHYSSLQDNTLTNCCFDKPMFGVVIFDVLDLLRYMATYSTCLSSSKHGSPWQVSPSHVTALAYASSFAATADILAFIDALIRKPITSIHRW